MGAVVFQRLFTVLVCIRCNQGGTVSINTVITYGISWKVLINCTYCGELLTTWTQRQLIHYNHSPFLYNVQQTLYIVESVKAAHNNGMNPLQGIAIFAE